MRKLSLIIMCMVLYASCTQKFPGINKSSNNLNFKELSKSWDEAIPLGNGMLGALVWQKGNKLRLSLDRADLWDLRPMENLKTPEWKFKWVHEQWKNNTYHEVQKRFDVPYDNSPAPSKIPAGALEFDISGFGKVVSATLDIRSAICEVVWDSGIRFISFVHANQPIGWYKFEGLDKTPEVKLIEPEYSSDKKDIAENPVTGQDLRRLGYSKGKVIMDNNSVVYTQKGWKDFEYQISSKWKQKGSSFTGCWSASSNFEKNSIQAESVTKKYINKDLLDQFDSHISWWDNYWSKATISIPDKIIEKQWYQEMYKFGSAARDNAPPISLQSVWTADNGKLPPWKGDFHHDLNTQLSYWPAYSGNQLDLEMGFLNWMWKYKDTFEKYSKDYFGCDGINVPGVSTLDGAPMGGWIQYSFGPTVSAWLAQHFYLHWRYSMDEKFLKTKAYPWIKGVAVFLDQLSVKDKNGLRKLPISSSPEINDNSRAAWFPNTTNFDLALIRWTYTKAAELAEHMNNKEDAKQWKKILSEWPYYSVDDKTGLMFAPSLKYKSSHRHFSHLMAIHPMGLIDWSGTDKDREIIENTISNLKNVGSDYWVGYSFSWLANIEARMLRGDDAAKTLRIFAENFCLKNSFHVNGEQKNKGYSKFKYRPFTLEGNFAFASGVNEMLIQSHTGKVVVFPAIPSDWKELSFIDMRTEGAFLVSAKMEQGETQLVKIRSEKGGILKIKNPFGNNKYKVSKKYKTEGNTLVIDTKVDDEVILERG